ncbi:MAG: polyprenyl synthetase family protein [Bacteroidetes bacterium]|nr:polyprenyl synthetase family protein [Bacteroidota bacterium]
MKHSVDTENYSKIYKQQLRIIEKRLAKLLVGKEPESLYKPCEYILQAGGKRLRPFLVLISAQASGGNYNQVYNAALAVEILHNFTLVHDDIMDNSMMRRGRATLHNKYDLSTAILAGDSLIALAYQNLFKDCKDDAKKIFATFTQGVVEVCEGQSYDKEFELRKSVSISEYKKMIYKKTAALTEMCCSIGAQIAGADNVRLKALKNYGKNLGMAFQIHDDLLDITAKQHEFGKMIGSDLIEGKKTYLFLRALEKAKGLDKKAFLKVIDRKGIKQNEVLKYKELYFKLGVVQDAEREIVKYTKLALENLTAIKNKEAREIMNWLANYLTYRNK